MPEPATQPTPPSEAPEAVTPEAEKVKAERAEVGKALSGLTDEEVEKAVEGIKSDELKLEEAFEAAELPDLIKNVDDYRRGLNMIKDLVLTEDLDEHNAKLAALSAEDKELMKQCLELGTPKEDPIEEKARARKERELLIASYQKDIFEGEPTEEIRKAQEVYDAKKAEKESTA